MGGDGHMEALYQDLVPGKTVEELVARRFSFENSTKSYRHCWVAEIEGDVAGDLHAYPFDAMAADTGDPIISEERYAVLAPFDYLDPVAVGSFHINILAVYPEFRGRGVGSMLLDHAKHLAKSKGFDRLSLAVFEENSGAVRLYQRHGFKEAARHPASRHPAVIYGGDLLMMVAGV